MLEVINVIEKEIREKHEIIRALHTERDQILEALTDNRSNLLFQESKLKELNNDLQSLYNIHYNKKATAEEALNSREKSVNQRSLHPDECERPAYGRSGIDKPAITSEYKQ